MSNSTFIFNKSCTCRLSGRESLILVHQHEEFSRLQASDPMMWRTWWKSYEVLFWNYTELEKEFFLSFIITSLLM